MFRKKEWDLRGLTFGLFLLIVFLSRHLYFYRMLQKDMGAVLGILFLIALIIMLSNHHFVNMIRKKIGKKPLSEED